MYSIVLALHNITRWLVLISGVAALIRAYLGWRRAQEWSASDRIVGVFFASFMDVQLLLGLLLYFVISPITRAAFQNPSAIMGNSDLRFFTVEHIGWMLLAVVSAHIGTILSKKAANEVDKHRRAAIWFSLSLVMILIGMPWTRPLLPRGF